MAAELRKAKEGSIIREAQQIGFGHPSVGLRGVNEDDRFIVRE